jgi:hypothetical protein
MTAGTTRGLAAVERRERVQQLRNLMRQCSRTKPIPSRAHETVGEQNEELSLPWLTPDGWPAGGICEWISACDPGGTWELVSHAISRVLPNGRWLVVDVCGEWHPPALVRDGVNLGRVIWVRPPDESQVLWVVEQGLRSRGVDVVCCRIDRMTPLVGRRLKLAAEAGGACCVLPRGPDALRQASIADVRMLVTPKPSPTWERRRFAVEMLRMKSTHKSTHGGPQLVEYDHESHVVRLVSELADPAGSDCSTGA